MNEATQKVRRTLTGRVVSDKMQKAVTVLVERRVKHPIGKIVTRSRKYSAHIEGLEAGAGAAVQIVAHAPVPQTKAWRVAPPVEKGRAI